MFKIDETVNCVRAHEGGEKYLIAGQNQIRKGLALYAFKPFRAREKSNGKIARNGQNKNRRQQRGLRMGTLARTIARREQRGIENNGN